MSPTAPTYVTLNNQLTKAHSRIRELQARETALAVDNRTLRAVITELTHDDHPRTAELASWSNDGREGFGIGFYRAKSGVKSSAVSILRRFVDGGEDDFCCRFNINLG